LKLRIGTILPLIISGLALLPLKSPDTLSVERRAEIAKVGASADQAFRYAVQHLREIPEMKAGEKDIADAERTFREFISFRAKVDANLAKPGAERAPEIVQGFAAAITNLILVAGNRLRITLETLTSPPSAQLAQLVGLRHLAAQMAENAGRERALLGGIIGAHSKLSSETISGTIERLSEISSTIAAAVEEQGAATQEISRNVQQAAQGTQQVSSHIIDVQRGAGETGSASSQVLSAAQSLSGDSDRLKLEVGKFLNSVRAA
jgi:hypothetical protein